MILCFLNTPASPNDFFTSLWMSKCLLRFLAWPNCLLHWTQVTFFSLIWVAMWLFKFPAWLNDSSHSEQKCIFSPLFESKCLVISLWVWVGLGTSSTMAFVQLNDLRIFLYSERRNEKYHQVTVTHSMWSFWGWAEQFDCSDSSLYHVYKYSMVGIRRWQNPNCYHYCQNPTMVGFWLVGICWGTNSVIPRPNGKFFNHEEWFVAYLTYL